MSGGEGGGRSVCIMCACARVCVCARACMCVRERGTERESSAP